MVLSEPLKERLEPSETVEVDQDEIDRLIEAALERYEEEEYERTCGH